MANDSLTVFEKILAAYSLVIAIVGTLGNIIVFRVCFSKPLREKNTFKFLMFIAVTDTLSLYEWNMNHFILAFFQIDFNFRSLVWCRLAQFIQYSSLQCSAWILVSIALDRVLSIKVKKWQKFYFCGKRPVLFAFFVVFIMCGLNFVVLLTNGYSINVNGTEVIICYAMPDYDFSVYRIMGQIQLYNYSIVPFSVLFILNFFLIYIVLESSRKTVAPTAGLHQKQGLHRKVQMTKTIILMTLSFIVLTLPGAIVSGFYYLKLMSLDFGPLIINLCDDISFSFHSMTLFTLLYSNKAFFNQFQVVFFNKVFVQENSVSHTAHTN